jgi:hypothetical protein
VFGGAGLERRELGGPGGQGSAVGKGIVSIIASRALTLR